MLEPPYLLYLGRVTDPLAAKTARGIAIWRPELVIGQFRTDAKTISLGLEDLGFAAAVARGSRTMVIGIANAGGVMDATIIAHVLLALQAGLDVASGLHERLSDHEQIRQTANALDRRLWDVRDPPRPLPVGTGDRRKGKRLLTIGTDCAVGKMYATLAIERELGIRGVPATFRATGQTGILIAGKGIPIDAVVADFISGAAERLSPSRDDGGWDLIEGQGSLFHPAFAGVSLGLLHGSQPDALVLCHEAGRTRMRHCVAYSVPELSACLARNVEAARLTNAAVVPVGVALNTSALTEDHAKEACLQAEEALSLPCQDPMRMGVDRIVDRLLATR